MSDIDLDQSIDGVARGGSTSSEMGVLDRSRSVDGSARSLGLTRWVQFAFVAAFVALAWFLDKVITYIWGRFEEPPAPIVTGISAVLSLIIVVLSYRNPRLYGTSNQVASELSQVTWPDRQETWSSTIVVIVTSLIAAAILGSFDAIFKLLSDWVYGL